MHTGKMTKIIATIGPASDSEELIKKLILSGVNIFRFNMKHNIPDWHLERIDRVQKVADNLKIKIGILIDLQGPEIRIETKDQQDIDLTKDQTVVFCNEFSQVPNGSCIRIAHDVVLEALEVGDTFSIEDGFHTFEVVNKTEPTVLEAKIQHPGVVKHRKSLNLVGKDVALPSLIEEDLEKLDKTAKSKIDFVALSFVRTKEDIDILRSEMTKRGLKAEIVAKIESQKGIENIDEIIETTDSVMIARGDLGIEVPMEQISYLQKLLIEKCRNKNKPVIVATQMLQSMIDNPLPTRAEAADVANAVYDRTDCVMLSGETATGKYPVRAVDYMQRIIRFNEDKLARINHFPEFTDQTHAISKAALAMLEPESGVKVDLVLLITESGYTARVFSSYRPNVPVLALSANEKTVEYLTMSYGVMPRFVARSFEGMASLQKAVENVKEEGLIKEGDKVLVVYGNKLMRAGATNALIVLDA